MWPYRSSRGAIYENAPRTWADIPHDTPSRKQPRGAAQLADVREEVQGFLLNLAQLLPPVYPGSTPPNCIKLWKLKNVLPVPPRVIEAYGSVRDFIEATPALEWADREGHRNWVSMVPLHHERLLRAAAEGGQKRYRRGY